MKWPWPPPTRKDVLIFIVMMLIGFGAYFVQTFYFAPAKFKSNYGFGPEWDCVGQPKGDPTCIKKKP